MPDQGTEFCGNVIVTMCSLLGVEKIRTTPYHPQINGSAERVHQTLQRMIGELDGQHRINTDCLQLNTVIGNWVFPVLSYVGEEAPVAYLPVVPYTQDTNDDLHHRQICSQPVRPLLGIPGDHTGLCWERGPKAEMVVQPKSRGRRVVTRGSHTGTLRCLSRTEEETQELVGWWSAYSSNPHGWWFTCLCS